ncbi:SLC13 family permease [Haladaptatus halobius]|uniref:SLC13 family permease n=1 Tax=Haladaptatus halobius TaxID=2884875 RepID=UPI001D0BD16A|nr:SLC13 family permease [Haladaptatus halobius]
MADTTSHTGYFDRFRGRDDPQGGIGILLLGPVLFMGSLLTPFSISWKIQGAIGLLAWIVIWMVSGIIRLEIVFLLPVVIVSIVPLAPWQEVVSVYWDPLVLFIFGAVGIATGWKYWGFTRRVALRSLYKLGYGPKSQILVWFGLAAVFSAVIPDTVTAAMFIPIAVTILHYQGYETADEIRASSFPSLVLLAIGWGAAVGGSATPLGGGMDILTIELLSDHVGYSIPFTSWIYHLLPFTVLNFLLVGTYLYYVFDIDATEVPTSKSFYQAELTKLDSIKQEEIIVVGAWLLAFGLVLLEPLYGDVLENSVPWFDPLLAFPIICALLFVIPAKSGSASTILNADVITDFPLPVLFIWPGAIALAKILTLSGAVDALGAAVDQYLTLSLLGFLLLAIIVATITNITTNTAAAAALIPVIISIAAKADLPVATFVYAAAAMLNISYALPSANGCLALTTGFGADTNKMVKHGTVLCILTIVLITVYSYLASQFIPGWNLP